MIRTQTLHRSHLPQNLQKIITVARRPTQEVLKGFLMCRAVGRGNHGPMARPPDVLPCLFPLEPRPYTDPTWSSGSCAARLLQIGTESQIAVRRRGML